MADDRSRKALEPTSSQTVGPYFHIGLAWLFSASLADLRDEGARISIQGRVLDGDGEPVVDAVLEFWQADAEGHYPSGAVVGRGASFSGAGRVATDETGSFRFKTVKPGRVVAPDGRLQAPHVLVHVFMRGLLRPLVTRIYFADERHDARDFVLDRVPAARRRTLLAMPLAGLRDEFEWNVVLQGEGETVFFDV